VVAAVEPHSPSAAALAVGDVILAVDGARANAEQFDAIVAAGHPGDRLGLTVSRKGQSVGLSLVLAHRLEQPFRITRAATPSALQAAILASWTAPARH
jgi:S1-C subfamily serine protease